MNPTIELVDALTWAGNQADIAAAEAAAAGSLQDAADKRAHALELHLALTDVLLARRRSALREV